MKKLLFTLALGLTMAWAAVGRAATTADIVFVVDESGSMAGEHAWIAGMVSALDTALGGAGVTGNRYGLVGFGASGAGGHAVAGHKELVGGGDFGTAAQLAAATGSLVISGGTEDGYSGLALAFSGYSFRPGAAVNIILITDEDRDILGGSPHTKASILSSFTANGALLNAVVSASFVHNVAPLALLGSNGDDPANVGYKEDGAGGFVKVTDNGGTSNITVGAGAGTTIADYVDLAWATGGAAWDLNQLRAGGLTAASFTKAFVDLKVEEIIVQPPGGEIPEPATMLAWAFGAVAFGGVRAARRRLRA